MENKKTLYLMRLLVKFLSAENSSQKLVLVKFLASPSLRSDGRPMIYTKRPSIFGGLLVKFLALVIQ